MNSDSAANESGGEFADTDALNNMPDYNDTSGNDNDTQQPLRVDPNIALNAAS